jgi:general secretion pathway protein G
MKSKMVYPGLCKDGLHRKGKKSWPHSHIGFTLVELLFVIIIIGALAALVFPNFARRSQEAKKEAARAFIMVELATALREYEMDNARFPTTEEGLAALFSRPQGARNWRGPYIARPAVDPWGRTYKYRSPGEMFPRSYDLYSLGADGKKGKDDITNWQD